MNNLNTSQPVDLGQLSAHMPWAQVFEDLQYPMPYPEVVMAGELAFAQFTQMNSLLMMLSWEGDSRASYTLERLTPDDPTASAEVYRLSIEVYLDGFNEGWAVLGISEPSLLDYIQQAVAAWAIHQHWANKQTRSVRVDDQMWNVIVMI